MSPDGFRFAVFVGLLALFAAVEARFPRRPWETSRLRRWGVHLGVALLNTVLLRLLVAAPLLAWAEFVRDRGWGLAPWLGLRGGAEIVASFVVLDLFDYWWHRWNHRAPFLWRFHRVHHMDTHVDVTTSLRFHFGEFLLSSGMKAVWLLVWGPSVWGFALFEAGITAFAQFHHSNIDLSDRAEGWARRVIMTPRLHAGHHTVALRTRDANFSTVFLAWDHLFGSFEDTDPWDLEALGLPEEREAYLTPRALLVSPFQ